MAPLFQALPLSAIKPGGWILHQLQRDLQEGFAGRLDALTPHASHDLFKDRISASQDQVAWWDSETRGNWLWGYVMMAHLAGDAGHMARSIGLIDDLIATQDPDGYIGIYSPEWRYNHPPGENGELWSQSRALLCILSAYELTGQPRYLQAAERAAKLTLNHYAPSGAYFQNRGAEGAPTVGLGHGLCYTDAVEWLFRITGDAAYRDFGLWLYDDFNRMPVPFDNDDCALPNLLQRGKAFSGHAVHTVEHIRALALRAAYSEAADHHSGLANAMFKLGCYALPSGAVIGDESMHGLPLPESGYEYCTTTEMLFSLASMVEKFATPTYGDWMERIAFNAAQGARFSDGSGVAYLSADTRLSATHQRPDSYSHLHGGGGRYKFSATHEDIACCCNPNAVRLMPHYVSRMWFRAPDGLVAAAYGPCVLTTQVNDTRVSITEETAYPFENAIRFTVTAEQPIPFTIRLRKPAWAASVTVTADGATIDQADGYITVHKIWGHQDQIAVQFAAEVRLEAYHNGEYSVHWGALQFAQSIAHHSQTIKDYPVSGFHDYDLTPIDLRVAYQFPILDERQPGYALAPEYVGNANAGWDFPAVRLRFSGGALVPLGCTVLRRSAFPLIRKE